MKILHLSHEKLPDWRVEKAALTGCKYGHTVYFAGLDSPNYSSNVFKKIIKLDWTWQSRLGFPYYYHLIKKQVKRILDEIKPDVIHAHNIFAGKMASEFDYPIVYDDHEYWIAYVKHLKELISKSTSIKNSILSLPRKVLKKNVTKLWRFRSQQLWKKWEEELVSNFITITVSDSIATELRKFGRTVFVVPNFPTITETKNFQTPIFHKTVSSVYAGIESPSFILPHRNINGLTDLFQRNSIGNLIMIGENGQSTDKVFFKGRLQRNKMYEEMMKHSIGLLPWKQHPSHNYVNPNKVFEYAHAGLLVICTSLFISVKDYLKNNCLTYEDNNELVGKLEYFQNNMEDLFKKRVKIFEFAQKNLLWENYDDKILEAYKLCNSKEN